MFVESLVNVGNSDYTILLIYITKHTWFIVIVFSQKYRFWDYKFRFYDLKRLNYNIKTHKIHLHNHQATTNYLPTVHTAVKVPPQLVVLIFQNNKKYEIKDFEFKVDGHMHICN